MVYIQTNTHIYSLHAYTFWHVSALGQFICCSLYHLLCIPANVIPLKKLPWAEQLVFFCVMTNVLTLKYSFYDTNISPEVTADLGCIKLCHVLWLIDSVLVHSSSSQHFQWQLFSSEKALRRTTAFNLLSTYKVTGRFRNKPVNTVSH